MVLGNFLLIIEDSIADDKDHNPDGLIPDDF